MKKPSEKTAQSKTSAGFGRLFGNAVKKQTVTPVGDNKTSSGDRTRSSEVVQTVSRSSVDSEKCDTLSSVTVTVDKSSSSKAVSGSPTKAAKVSKPAHKQWVSVAICRQIILTLCLLLVLVSMSLIYFFRLISVNLLHSWGPGKSK